MELHVATPVIYRNSNEVAFLQHWGRDKCSKKRARNVKSWDGFCE